MNEGYRRGIELFNQKEFFECHEVWEEVWFAESGAAKRFYQGLIQVAVAFHHYENANYAGAIKLIDRGLEKLRPYGSTYGGLDLEALLGQLELWRQKFHEHLAGHRPAMDLTIPTLELRNDGAC